MPSKNPYIKSYCFILALISSISIYYFVNHQLAIKDEMQPAIIVYFVIKSFLIFANFTRVFKAFRFNPILFRTLFNLGIGLLLAFLYLQLYRDSLLILTDCGLCLITVFSLMKMHQNKNEKQNYI